jgi:HEAT repeat protein
MPSGAEDLFLADPAAARLAPTPAQESAAEVRAVQAIAQTLHKAVQACRMYATDKPPVAFVEQLERGLAAYLATQRFLRLQVTPAAFVFRGVEVLRDAGRDMSLPRLLGGDGVVELLFKDGVTRTELGRLVDALHRAASHLDPSHSPATLLWEADLRHVVFRSHDEFPHAGASAFDVEALVRESETRLPQDAAPEPPEARALDRLLGGTSTQVDAVDSRQLDADPASGAAMVSAASENDVFLHPAAAGAQTELRQALQITPRDRSTLRALALPRADETLLQLARQLTGIALSDADEPLAAPARGVLGDLVEALIAQRKMTLARDVVRFLQGSTESLKQDEDVLIGGAPAPSPDATTGENAPAAVPVSAPRALLESVIDRICEQRNVLALGGVLDDARAEASNARAVREILGSLRENAVGPLCTLLSRLENMQARKLVCQVLAAAAVAEPAMLARRAEGEPWYVARNMAYVMGRIGGSKVLPHLRRWSRHGEPRVRVEVARALGRVRHHSSATILCEMLADEETRVRQSAVWSLATLGDVRVLARLRAILFDERSFRSRRPEERDDFFRTYGRLADEVVYQELVRLLQHRTLVGVGWQTELRRGAALALGETGRPEAAELLDRQLGTRDTRLREACASALRSFKNRGLAAAPEGPAADWFGAEGAAAQLDAEPPDVTLEVEGDD